MVSAFEGILVPSFFGDFHANFHTGMRSYTLFTACCYRVFLGDFYTIRCANIGLLVSLTTWCCRTFQSRTSTSVVGSFVIVDAMHGEDICSLIALQRPSLSSASPGTYSKPWSRHLKSEHCDNLCWIVSKSSTMRSSWWAGTLRNFFARVQTPCGRCA